MKSYIEVTDLNSGKVRKYSTFRGACRKLNLPYHSLKVKKLPIVWDGYYIERIELNFEKDYFTAGVIIVGVSYFAIKTLINIVL